MPQISSGIYWLSGSMTYQLSNILNVAFLYFIIKFFKTNKRKYYLLTVFIMILIIGTNELSMILIDFFVFILFIILWDKNKKVNYQILLLLLIALIFTFLFQVTVIL